MAILEYVYFCRLSSRERTFFVLKKFGFFLSLQKLLVNFITVLVILFRIFWAQQILFKKLTTMILSCIFVSQVMRSSASHLSVEYLLIGFFYLGDKC